ncbi:unnamed protein product [Zymoseptoria tritici ST99CH_3D7]|uniref:Small ribosomal subunit protein mS38 n=1 Tax=Zymoseptoria tritici (strain ST99CH_3D7) TaxID=1276538 RepID=A0A1X7RFP9_ZYMT9|nr:unnamed protein product [Zymoseptoria tritici ST99CH_3D7]
MFSTKAVRVAHRASCAAAISSASSSSTSAHRSPPCVATRRSHQRRHSSSKASSCPPESNPNDTKPAPATKASAELAGSDPQNKASKRINKTKRSRAAADVGKLGDQFAGLPAVPGTQHLNSTDLSVSSFFSLHRPLSLSTTIPPPSRASAFDNIFETTREVDPWENGNSAEGRPEDVTYALKGLFENLDLGSNSAQDDAMRFEILQESQSNQDGVRHLDGAPRLKSVDEIVASFRPFSAPPAPQPFPEEQKAADKAAKKPGKTQKKSYAATIFLTESTSANGERTWTAASVSPMYRVPSPVDHTPMQTPRRFPFRERMRLRAEDYLRSQREKMGEKYDVNDFVRRDPSAASKQKMMLISVKRQRKLKMKKHKYKKLMKRTRNLRRRQDRA